jgi:2-phospho-L-lactate guanylyltransferase
MRTLAVVPFKRFSRAKTRLRTRYSDWEVNEIGRAMLRDVLSALAGPTGVERTVVVTEDPQVAAVASECGVVAHLLDPDPGLNPAIELAGREATREGFDAMLVVLGDLPLLGSADVDAIVEAGARHPVVLVASTDGGTAALFRRPPDRIPARFGEQSASAHAAEARAVGLEPADVPSIGEPGRLDLDTLEDADRILELGLPCRTLDLLRKFAP